MFNTGISKPEDYGTETIEVIKAEELVPENTYAVSASTKPNVIMIQLESFFDPLLWKKNPVTGNPESGGTENYDPIPFSTSCRKIIPMDI